MVHIKPDGLIKVPQGLAGDDSRETIVTDETTDIGPVVLFNSG
jgi:hypothetical protein